MSAETDHAASFDLSTPLRTGHKRTKKRLNEVTKLLETLAALGRARKSGDRGWMST